VKTFGATGPDGASGAPAAESSPVKPLPPGSSLPGDPGADPRDLVWGRATASAMRSTAPTAARPSLAFRIEGDTRLPSRVTFGIAAQVLPVIDFRGSVLEKELPGSGAGT